MDDDDDPRWDRWRWAIVNYRRTGMWPHEGWRPLLPFPQRTLRSRRSCGRSRVTRSGRGRLIGRGP